MNYTKELKITKASSLENFNDGRNLFKEYAKAINFDAGFKDFTAELSSLAKRYSAPQGALLLAYHNNKAVGCIAILQMRQGIGELKRFYVKPAFRQYKIGAQLLAAVITTAKELQFHHLRLEVIPNLTKAKALYHSFGFYTIEPYQVVVMEGTTYMEKNLLN